MHERKSVNVVQSRMISLFKPNHMLISDILFLIFFVRCFNLFYDLFYLIEQFYCAILLSSAMFIFQVFRPRIYFIYTSVCVCVRSCRRCWTDIALRMKLGFERELRRMTERGGSSADSESVKQANTLTHMHTLLH